MVQEPVGAGVWALAGAVKSNPAAMAEKAQQSRILFLPILPADIRRPLLRPLPLRERAIASAQHIQMGEGYDSTKKTRTHSLRDIRCGCPLAKERAHQQPLPC